jgi:hypothetical protein
MNHKEDTKPTGNDTIVPANLGRFEKTEILMLLLRMAYFKLVFQVLGGIVSFPVCLVFSESQIALSHLGPLLKQMHFLRQLGQ